jgi:hypothetical protein
MTNKGKKMRNENDNVGKKKLSRSALPKKFAGWPPLSLIMSMVAIASPAPLTSFAAPCQ